MSHITQSASIVTAGLVIAALINGGLYETHLDRTMPALLWKVNRLTGAVVACTFIDSDGLPNFGAEATCVDMGSESRQEVTQAFKNWTYLVKHPEEASKYGMDPRDFGGTPSDSTNPQPTIGKKSK